MDLLSWMVYSVAVGALLGGAGLLLERTLLASGRPVRWIWAAALVGAVAIPALELRSGAQATDASAAHPLGVTADAPIGPAGTDPDAIGEPGPFSFAALRRPFRALGDWTGSASSEIAALLPIPAGLPDRLGLRAWAGGALALILFGLLGIVRLSRLRHLWPRARLEGEEVRISPALGPAVVGLLRPEIVLPRWLVAAAPGTLRMILLHEREHIRGRDTLLLAGGGILATAAFWNPAGWWIFARLRGAVELDCDRRVLETGVSKREYGELLLEVGERSRPLPLPLAALAEPTSLLERRLRQMKKSSVRKSLTTSLGAGALALLLVIVACETSTPAATEAPEARTAGVAELRESPAVTEEKARREATETEVAEGAAGVAHFEEVRVSPDEDAGSLVRRPTSSVILREAMEQAQAGAAPTPLFIVDGVIMSAGVVDIDALDIETIEVVKGAEAHARYGSRASGGVIMITTKEHER